MEFNSSSTFKPVDPRRSGFNIDSQKEKRLQVRDDQTGNTSIEKVAYTYEMLLEKFPKKCPPGGNNSVVLYTSLDVMGDTNRVRSTFQNLQINYSLRDIINPAYEEELRNLLGELAELPALFVKGRYIGGTNEVQKLNKEGKLNILLAGATGSTFKAARGDQKGNGFEIDRIWEPPLESTPVDMKISSNRYTWEMLLEKFPKKCPPGGENSVVLYTSLEVMGDTNRIRSTFQNIRINYSVRNISNLDYEEELTKLLGKVEVPALFVQGRYIGGTNEVQKLNKEGKLKILFGGIPKY
ncbi:hypothetical protein IFM89_003337 [Coptis chinensis]|uniref:Glutaredoxin domain-containing protein n=1 Tax=Coptis chinensis TaxID=261450 RepID=A0A835IVR0_9MAGN|nr:hypothetical protein IFM89_003337 [Coptis chinensis]